MISHGRWSPGRSAHAAVRAAARARAGERVRPGARLRGRTATEPASVLARAVALSSLLLLAGGCGGDRSSSGVTVEEIPSPARTGSSAPNLVKTSEGAMLTWIEADAAGDPVVRLDRWRAGEGWAGGRTVAGGPDLHVDWADVPSALETRDGTLVAQWLVRGGAGGYGIRTAFSTDGGASWSDPRVPHDDDAPVEHGFATLVDLGAEGVGIVWLDGRADASTGDVEGDESGPGPEVSLRFRIVEPGAADGAEEVVVDHRTCECCQTDVASVPDGILVVYRDRDPDEVRDIHRVRRVDGRWEESAPVYRDEWVFGACPVNGPAVASEGARVAAAWFTGVGGEPRVQLAFSDDGGRSFGRPVRIDGGWPGGRADVELTPDGGALVSWLERTGGEAEVRIRRVTPEGAIGASVGVGVTASATTSGFPRMAPVGGSAVLLAWTEATAGDSRVRVVRAAVDAAGGNGTGGGR